MRLKIFNQSGTLKLIVSTSSSSTWNDELMTENAVSASFTHPEFVQLDVNDYVLLEGVKFSIKKEYKPKQKDTQTYAYSVKFYAPVHDAEQVMYLNLTDGQYEPQFSLDGSPREHLQIWVDNINRIYGEERWRIGDVIDAPNQTIEYSNTTCWDAIGSIAESFSTEWWADGNYINLCRCERGERVSLGYMKGLTSLVQSENSDNVKFFTRLIPLGTTKNIDRNRYGFSRLQLPNRAKYVDRNTQYGLYEHVETDAFAEIFPHYTGTVTTVRTEEKIGDDKKPFTVYNFKDSGMTFDPCENEIAGLVKHVSFQTGDLAGRDFEANYNSTAKEWEIINTYPTEDMQIPGGNLIPRPGDKYIPWNFRMPEEYEIQAEKDYEIAVNDFLAKYSEDISKYGGDTDYTYIDKHSVPLLLGQNVRLLSDEYFSGIGYRDTRMTKVVRKLDNLSIATIECTNQVGKGWKKNVDDSLSGLQYVVGEKLNQALIEVLKSWDSREPSEYNVFSALRSIKEITNRAISKMKPDETEYLVKFLGGLYSNYMQSLNFASGPLGEGFLIKADSTGRSYLEVDEAYIRLKAVFDNLEIHHVSHVGGQIVLSPASMECIKVETASTDYEELVDSAGDVLTDSGGDILHVPVISSVPDGVYRCYFKTTDGEKAIINEFAVDDLGQCREFNIKEGVYEDVANQFYWRRVVNVSDEYIDLSIQDCAPGSMAPKAGDTIVAIGNKTDKSRQHAIVLSTMGDDAPSIKQYAGIDDYSMAGKEVTVLSPNGNKITGQFVIEAGSTGGNNIEGIEQPDIEGIKESIGNLQDYVDGAFADGIISEVEAVAIEKYINIVNSIKQEVESTYEALYLNPYLSGTAEKTNLLNAKITLFGLIDALVSAINAAISDGKTTVKEKEDVDNAFSAFNNAYASMSVALEYAEKAIQDKLKSYSDAAQELANSNKLTIENIPAEIKDTIAINLGYTDYASLQAMAENGKTLIKGGRVNTELIEARAIVTSQLIADAIMSTSLNVNNKFKVSNTGEVSLEGNIVGRLKSSSNGTRLEISPEDGTIYLYYDDGIYGYLGWNTNGLNLTIIDPVSKVRTSISPGRISLSGSGTNNNLSIDLNSLSGGVLYADEDGIVRIKPEGLPPTPSYYYIVALVASPEDAGTLTGGGRWQSGHVGIISAQANKGYAFRAWSDGNTNASREWRWAGNETVSAYFDKTYSVILSAYPIDSGTVTGEGDYIENNYAIIKAVPTENKVFTKWSDGNIESTRTIKMTQDLSLVAYFSDKPEQELGWLVDFSNNNLAKLTGNSSIYHALLLSSSKEFIFDYVPTENGTIMLERRAGDTSSAYIMSATSISFLQKKSDGTYQAWVANYPFASGHYRVSIKMSVSVLNENGMIVSVNGTACTDKTYANNFYDVLHGDGTYKLVLSTFEEGIGAKLISIECGNTILEFTDKSLIWKGFPDTYGNIAFSIEGATLDQLIKQEQIDK